MGSIHTFQLLRSRMIAIAYRMLGSVTEADDALQDAWLRWQDVDEAAVRDPRAWLSTTVSRICIDRLTSARARREAYPGEWLPEPVITSEPVDVESISLGLLAVLERLTPVERAAFVLHKVFDYSHAEVAEILGMNEANVRQTFHRAREHVAHSRPRFHPSREMHQRLLAAFAAALASGDAQTIERLLARDATLWADGGGKVRGAAGRPIHGAAAIAKFFSGLVAKSFVATDQSAEIRDVNGWPALVGYSGGRINAVLTIEGDDDERIVAIRNVINPDKLALRELA